MAGESGRVDCQIVGDDDRFRIRVWINAFEVRPAIPVGSIVEGEDLTHNLDPLLREVYRLAWRRGYSDCQQVIKQAIGVDR